MLSGSIASVVFDLLATPVVSRLAVGGDADRVQVIPLRLAAVATLKFVVVLRLAILFLGGTGDIVEAVGSSCEILAELPVLPDPLPENAATPSLADDVRQAAAIAVFVRDRKATRGMTDEAVVVLRRARNSALYPGDHMECGHLAFVRRFVVPRARLGLVAPSSRPLEDHSLSLLGVELVVHGQLAEDDLLLARLELPVGKAATVVEVEPDVSSASVRHDETVQPVPVEELDRSSLHNSLPFTHSLTPHLDR